MKKKLVPRRQSADLRNRPVPQSPVAIDTDEYQQVSIDSQSKQFAEPLVDLAAFGIATENFYGRSDMLNAPIHQRFPSSMNSVYARRGIARRLATVNTLLAPYGIELLVFDAFRPVSVQQELWDWFIAEARRTLANPSEQDCRRFALRFCSDPRHFDANNASTWPTHSTGGAIDLTLRELGSGRPLHMGGIYLDPSEVSRTRHYEENLRANSRSDIEAQRNRRLLYWSMVRAGFVNYPFEWWHFDCLTQAWVMNKGFPKGLKAAYGLANRGQSADR